MDTGVAITATGVSVGTSSTEVLRGNDANRFDTFDITITNNGGGVITAATLQGFTQVGGWVDLDNTNLTSNLVPLGPGATNTYSTDVGFTGQDKIRVMLTGSATVSVDVSVTGYPIGTRN